MDENTVNEVDSARHKYLHGIGRRMDGIIPEGNVTFNFHQGKYTGKHTLALLADEAKE